MRRGRYGNPWRLKLQFIQSAQLHQGQFLQASGGVGTKEGDLRPPFGVAVTHPFKVANRRILPADQTVPLWESVA